MKQKELLYLIISCFIVVLGWVSFNIYHIWVTSTISQDLQTDVTPISPDFDTTMIAKLKTRSQIAPLYQANAPQISPTPSISPSQNQSVVASESSIPTIKGQ